MAQPGNRGTGAEGLAKIVIRNHGGCSSTSGISFAGGVLTFGHQPHANVEYGEERAKGLQQVLGSGL